MSKAAYVLTKREFRSVADATGAATRTDVVRCSGPRSVLGPEEGYRTLNSAFRTLTVGFVILGRSGNNA